MTDYGWPISGSVKYLINLYNLGLFSVFTRI